MVTLHHETPNASTEASFRRMNHVLFNDSGTRTAEGLFFFLGYARYATFLSTSGIPGIPYSSEPLAYLAYPGFFLVAKKGFCVQAAGRVTCYAKKTTFLLYKRFFLSGVGIPGIPYEKLRLACLAYLLKKPAGIPWHARKKTTEELGRSVCSSNERTYTPDRSFS